MRNPKGLWISEGSRFDLSGVRGVRRNDTAGERRMSDGAGNSTKVVGTKQQNAFRTGLDLNYSGAVMTLMNITELTSQQLRRAASIKEKLDALNREFRNLLDRSSSNGAASGKKRTMSAAVKRKIAAAQRMRWAKLKRSHA